MADPNIPQSSNPDVDQLGDSLDANTQAQANNTREQRGARKAMEENTKASKLSAHSLGILASVALTGNVKKGVKGYATDTVAGTATRKLSGVMAGAFVVAADMQRDMRKLTSQSASLSSSAYSQLFDSITNIGMVTGLTQDSITTLVTSMAGLNLHVALGAKDFQKLAQETLKAGTILGMSEDQIAGINNELNKWSTKTDDIIDFYKEAYNQGRKYGLSLQDTQEVMRDTLDLMTQFGKVEASEQKQSLEGLSKLRAMYRDLGIDVADAMSRIKSIDFASTDSLRQISLVAAETGKSLNDLTYEALHAQDRFAKSNLQASVQFMMRQLGPSLFESDETKRANNTLYEFQKRQEHLLAMTMEYHGVSHKEALTALVDVKKAAIEQGKLNMSVQETSKFISDYLDKQGQSVSEAQAFETAWNDFSAQVMSVFERIKNVLQVILIEFGKPILFVFTGVAKVMNLLVTGVATLITNNLWIVKMAAAWASVAIGMSAVLSLMGKISMVKGLYGVIMDMVSGTSTLIARMDAYLLKVKIVGPIWWTTKALAVRGFSTINSVLNKTIDRGGVLGSVLGVLKKSFIFVGGAGIKALKAIQVAMQSLTLASSLMFLGITAAVAIFAKAFSFYQDLKKSGKNDAEAMKEAWKATGKWLWEMFSNLFFSVADLVGNLFGIDSISSIFKDWWKVAAEGSSGFGETLGKVIGKAIVEAILAIPKLAMWVVKKIFVDLPQLLSEVGHFILLSLGGLVEGLISGIPSLVKGLATTIGDSVVGKYILKPLWAVGDFFDNLPFTIVKALWSGLKNLTALLWEGIKSVVGFLFDALTFIPRFIGSGIKKVGSYLYEVMPDAAKQFIDPIANFFGKIGNFFSTIWDKLSNLGSTIKGWFSKVGDWIWEHLPHPLKWLAEKFGKKEEQKDTKLLAEQMAKAKPEPYATINGQRIPANGINHSLYGDPRFGGQGTDSLPKVIEEARNSNMDQATAMVFAMGNVAKIAAEASKVNIQTAIASEAATKAVTEIPKNVVPASTEIASAAMVMNETARDTTKKAAETLKLSPEEERRAKLYTAEDNIAKGFRDTLPKFLQPISDTLYGKFKEGRIQQDATRLAMFGKPVAGLPANSQALSSTVPVSLPMDGTVPILGQTKELMRTNLRPDETVRQLPTGMGDMQTAANILSAATSVNKAFEIDKAIITVKKAVIFKVDEGKSLWQRFKEGVGNILTAGGKLFGGNTGTREAPVRGGRRLGGWGDAGGPGTDAGKPVEPMTPSQSPGDTTYGTPQKGKLQKWDPNMTLADAFAVHESKGNYNIFNQGEGHRYKQGQTDFSKMTIDEVLRRQNLGMHDPNKLFATGKYQIIPDTLRDAKRKMKLTGKEMYDPAMQDRIFSEFLTTEKRPQIERFIKTGRGLGSAAEASAQEWASIGAAAKGGRSWYGGVNRAALSVESTQKSLQVARDRYIKAISEGKSEREAYKLATVEAAPSMAQMPDTQAPGTLDQMPMGGGRPNSLVLDQIRSGKTFGKDVALPSNLHIAGSAKNLGFKGVDPILMEGIAGAARNWKGRVDIFSSLRKGGRGNHKVGRALDVRLYDENGKEFVPMKSWSPNGPGSSRKANGHEYNAGVYEKFMQDAVAWGSMYDPKFANARWGGYFGDVKHDWMHIDTNYGKGGDSGRLRQRMGMSIEEWRKQRFGIGAQPQQPELRTASYDPDMGPKLPQFNAADYGPPSPPSPTVTYASYDPNMGPKLPQTTESSGPIQFDLANRVTPTVMYASNDEFNPNKYIGGLGMQTFMPTGYGQDYQGGYQQPNPYGMQRPYGGISSNPILRGSYPIDDMRGYGYGSPIDYGYGTSGGYPQQRGMGGYGHGSPVGYGYGIYGGYPSTGGYGSNRYGFGMGRVGSSVFRAGSAIGGMRQGGVPSILGGIGQIAHMMGMPILGGLLGAGAGIARGVGSVGKNNPLGMIGVINQIGSVLGGLGGMITGQKRPTNRRALEDLGVNGIGQSGSLSSNTGAFSGITEVLDSVARGIANSVSPIFDRRLSNMGERIDPITGNVVTQNNPLERLGVNGIGQSIGVSDAAIQLQGSSARLREAQYRHAQAQAEQQITNISMGTQAIDHGDKFDQMNSTLARDSQLKQEMLHQIKTAKLINPDRQMMDLYGAGIV